MVTSRRIGADRFTPGPTGSRRSQPIHAGAGRLVATAATPPMSNHVTDTVVDDG